MGLILALSSVPAASLSRLMDRSRGATLLIRRLYVDPLRNAALIMAVLAMLQVFILAPALPGQAMDTGFPGVCAFMIETEKACSALCRPMEASHGRSIPTT